MKFSVFVSHLTYCTIEVEAEDHQDAAQKVVAAVASDPRFALQQPTAEIEDIECEVVTAADAAAVNSDAINFEEYNGRVRVFDVPTVNAWLGELSPNYFEITEAGRRALEDE